MSDKILTDLKREHSFLIKSRKEIGDLILSDYFENETFKTTELILKHCDFLDSLIIVLSERIELLE